MNNEVFSGFATPHLLELVVLIRCGADICLEDACIPFSEGFWFWAPPPWDTPSRDQLYMRRHRKHAFLEWDLNGEWPWQGMREASFLILKCTVLII